MRVKRAHMVSRAYLKQWADKGGNVEVIDIQDRRGFTTDVVNATVVSYAYEPDLLNRDLEREFAEVEARGTPAIAKLRYGHLLSTEEKSDVVNFLDMHLQRGRFADQTKVRTSAIVLKTDGKTEEAELNLADCLMLSQYMEGPVRLASLEVEAWKWTTHRSENLATGDGAVLLWKERKEGALTAVTFPLAPDQVLLIGSPADLRFLDSLNARLAENSRKWIVGQRGSLNLEWFKSSS